jgi:phage shock protein C
MLSPMSSQLPPQPGPVRRSASDRVIAGVCGGIGRSLGVDPVVLRIAFVILALANGVGVIGYLIAWVAIPSERPGQPDAPVAEPRRETGRLVVGGSVIVLGLVLLLDRLAPDLGQLFWPVAVIAVGVVIVLVSLRR